jgi:hypothetical protein
LYFFLPFEALKVYGANDVVPQTWSEITNSEKVKKNAFVSVKIYPSIKKAFESFQLLQKS